MGTIASWLNEMGWRQTSKVSFWQNHSQDEFAGVVNGYWCVITDNSKATSVTVLYSPEDQLPWEVTAAEVKQQKQQLKYKFNSMVLG